MAVLEGLAPYSPTFAALLAAARVKQGLMGTWQDLIGAPGDLIKGPVEALGYLANTIKEGKLPLPIPKLPLPSIFDKAAEGVSKLPLPLPLPLPSIFDRSGDSGSILPLPLPIPKLPLPLPIGLDDAKLPLPIPKIPGLSLLGIDNSSDGGTGKANDSGLLSKLPIPSILSDSKLPLPVPKIPSLLG